MNVDDLKIEIETMHQRLCREAQIGGAATLDELADLAGNMAQMMQVVAALAKLHKL